MKDSGESSYASLPVLQEAAFARLSRCLAIRRRQMIRLIRSPNLRYDVEYDTSLRQSATRTRYAFRIRNFDHHRLTRALLECSSVPGARRKQPGDLPWAGDPRTCQCNFNFQPALSQTRRLPPGNAIPSAASFMHSCAEEIRVHRFGPKKAMKPTVAVDCASTSPVLPLWKKATSDQSRRYSTRVSSPAIHLYS